MEITLPYNFKPRDYQVALFKAIDEGYKRAVAIWHRRAGKDKSLINIIAKEMLVKKGTYYYFFPTYKQGKKILWNGMDREGFKFMDHIPKELRKRVDNQEMLVETVNGSIFQVIGTDNYDSIMGTNPIGCVFSEYSLQNPLVWDFIRPILAENGGWAIFNYTPRGENHGYDLYEIAKNNPKWFCQLLTVDDTKAIPDSVIEEERGSGMSEEMIQQEFYCSFTAGIQGAYYTDQIKKAEEEGRITNIPVEPAPVHTFWDLGMNDATSIWFTQFIGKEIRIIDYLEESGESLEYYVKQLQEKGYNYGTHYLPHDVEVRELGTGVSRLETFKSLGLRDIQVVPQLGIQEGINAVRTFFNKFWFDREKTSVGLRALKSYHKEYDEKRKTFKNHPHHDWSSNAADAIRYLAVSHLKAMNKTDLFPNQSINKSFI
jgi:phage terminase large subunit